MNDYRRLFTNVTAVGGPVLLDEAYSALMGAVLISLINRLGTGCLAEYTVAGLVQASLIGILGGIGTGAAVMVARATGAKDRRRARAVASKALAGSFGLGLALSLAGWLLGDRLLPATTVDPAALPAMARLFWLALPFLLSIQVGKSMLQGMGATGDAFRLSAFCSTACLLLGSFFVFAWPGLGVAAIATGICVSAAAGLLFCLLLIGRHAELGLSWRCVFGGEPGLVRNICRLSSPVVIEQCFLQLGFSLYVLILVDMGAEAFAANQIAQQLEGVSLAVGACLAATTIALVGKALGERSPDLARGYTRLILRIALAGMTAIGLGYFCFADVLVIPFTADATTRTLAAACLSIALLEQPTLAVAFVLGNALRAAGDTVWPMLSTVVGIWLVRLPLCWLLIAKLGCDIPVVWCITAADYFVRSVILAARYRAMRAAR